MPTCVRSHEPRRTGRRPSPPSPSLTKPRPAQPLRIFLARQAGLVKPGEWMLIHGVGGGTCQWAAQMAKLKGYKVIGTCPKGKEVRHRTDPAPAPGQC